MKLTVETLVSAVQISAAAKTRFTFWKMIAAKLTNSKDTYSVKCRTDSGLTQVNGKDSVRPRALNVHLSTGSGSRQSPQLQALHHLEDRQEIHWIACNLHKKCSYSTYQIVLDTSKFFLFAIISGPICKRHRDS